MQFQTLSLICEKIGLFVKNRQRRFELISLVCYITAESEYRSLPPELNQPKFERMLTVADVCEYLSVTNETVYTWIKKTDIPALRVGRKWLFDKTELDQWIKSGKGADK